MAVSRLLVADDHAVVRSGIINALKDVPDIQVEGEVGNGRDLFVLLAELQPDLLLIDVTMPDFEPISAIAQIHGDYPDMKILVVSAYDDDVYVQGLLGIGVNGYHLKDQPLSDLRLAVTRVLEGERWISSRILDKLIQFRETPSPLDRLTERQLDLLRLLHRGYDNRSIALELSLSIKTVENHLTRLYRIIDVRSRLEAFNYIVQHPEILAVPGERGSLRIARHPAERRIADAADRGRQRPLPQAIDADAHLAQPALDDLRSGKHAADARPVGAGQAAPRAG